MKNSMINPRSYHSHFQDFILCSLIAVHWWAACDALSCDKRVINAAAKWAFEVLSRFLCCCHKRVFRGYLILVS